jgi:hypothetical protein
VVEAAVSRLIVTDSIGYISKGRNEEPKEGWYILSSLKF